MAGLHPPEPLKGAAAILLAGCAIAPPGDPVGWIDGRAVTYGEVARHLRTSEPETFSRALESALLERLTREEAAASGAAVPPEALEGETARRMEEWEARVREAGGEPVAWLARTAGLTRAELSAYVRAAAEVELLQDRLLRYEQWTSPRLVVLRFPAADRAQADALARRAREGDVADGRRTPYPLLPADLGHDARPGDVVGPFAEADGWAVYLVEAVEEPLAGDYAALRERVEADLAARPVEMGEYERWRRRAFLRHEFLAAPPPAPGGER